MIGKKELCNFMKSSNLGFLGIVLVLLTLLSPVGCTYQDIRVTSITSASSNDEADLVTMAMATVLVQAETGTGSGVVFGDNLVLTAAHVLAFREQHVCDDGTPCNSLVIEPVAILKQEANGDLYLSQTTLLKLDEELDLAVLKLDLAYPYAKATIASAGPRLYQKCWISGHPHGVTDPFVTEGRVQDLWLEGFLAYSAPTTFGNSGGPVWIREGDKFVVVSVVQRVFVEGFGIAVNHMGLGAQPSAVREFVK